jgi:thiol-disulfide isomerase/thioredoxin
LLVRDVAAGFKDRVKVSIEEYGNSPIATRFGVRRYPAVFVDDVLFARPKDFGFGGDEDTSGGVYVPWLDPDNQRRFKDDLTRAVERRLAGEHVAGFDISDVTTGADPAEGPATFPALPLTDINGARVEASALEGKTVIVEMWATWCPPCRATLAWLNTFQRSHASDVTVIALAVDSKLEDVQALTKTLQPSYRVVFASADVVKAFGAVAAVPKLMIVDARGARARVMYGAPPDLHQQIEAAVKSTLAK